MNTNYMSACKALGKRNVERAFYFAQSAASLFWMRGKMLAGFQRTDIAGVYSFRHTETGLTIYLTSAGKWRGAEGI